MKLFLLGRKNYKIPLKNVNVFLVEVALHTKREEERLNILRQLMKMPEKIQSDKLCAILKLSYSSVEMEIERHRLINQLCEIDPSIADNFIVKDGQSF